MTVDIHSVQYRLWHDRFLCEMREMDSYSIDYIKIFGTLTTGDPEKDRQMRNDMSQKYLTVIEMLKYHAEGVNIYIIKPDDCATIYVLIQEHLQNWEREINHSLRPDNAPTEELVLMDKFADIVYDHAKWYLDTALADSPFMKRVKSHRSTALNLLKNPENEAQVDDDGIILHPKRDSLSDVFSQGPGRMHKRF